MTPRNARKSPHVRDGGDSVVSAARRRKDSRWRANADMIDSCCCSESAVAVVAKGTGSYLTDAMAQRSSAHCAAGHTTNVSKSTTKMIPWTSTHAGRTLGEGRLNTLPEGPLCPLSLRY